MDTHKHPSETIVHLAIYGGLFGHVFEALLNPPAPLMGPAALLATGVDTRLEFVKYCIPDYACYRYQARVRNRDGTIDPRRKCKAVGHYSPFAKLNRDEGRRYIRLLPNKYNNQGWILHLLRYQRWNHSWDVIRETVGGDFEIQWKQEIWKTVVCCQGLEGIEMLRPLGVEAWAERLLSWRKGIEKMNQEPGAIEVARHKTYEYPSLDRDLAVCLSGSL